MLRIYNGCLRNAVFPNAWKIGKVITIRKSQDEDPAGPSSYRPICLLSILGKVLEALILARWHKILDKQLAPEQYGFRKGKSTEDAINAFLEKVYQNLDCYTFAIF